jgi:hypothetical protein
VFVPRARQRHRMPRAGASRTAVRATASRIWGHRPSAGSSPGGHRMVLGHRRAARARPRPPPVKASVTACQPRAHHRRPPFCVPLDLDSSASAPPKLAANASPTECDAGPRPQHPRSPGGAQAPTGDEGVSIFPLLMDFTGGHPTSSRTRVLAPRETTPLDVSSCVGW